jgi:hypothetical protein
MIKEYTQAGEIAPWFGASPEIAKWRGFRREYV